VKRRAPIHASYVYGKHAFSLIGMIDLLHEMKPETVFVQLPPDLPVFIKNASEGKGDYRDKWYQFLKRAHDCSFLVNPRPKFTSDVVMHGDKLKRLF
jgi:hypothetical protein